MDNTKKIILGLGAAAGAAAILYYLLKDEKKPASAAAGDAQEANEQAGQLKVEEITTEHVKQILQEIIASQEEMKGYMKELTKELLSKHLSFEQTYQRVREVQPRDPLDKHGLSMMDFDRLLDKHQNDPHVREAIAKIMGAPSPGSRASEKVQGITVAKIIEVHVFMLAELEKLVETFQSLPDKEAHDMKTVTIAAQAVVGSKAEAQFGISSEDIESAVLMHHTMLATDQEFAQTNIQMQHTLAKLMGTPMP